MVLFGGRKPINLSKKQAVKALAERAKAYIKKKDKSDVKEPDFDLPREIVGFVAPIKEKLSAVSDDIKNDRPVIQKYLEKMSDYEIQEVKAVFEIDKNERKKINTEDKLVSVAQVVLKDVKKIDAIIPHLLHLRECVIGSFVEAYSNEFSTNKGSDRVFSNEEFMRSIEHIVSYRKGLMRGSERTSESSEPSVQEGCSIM